MTPLGRIFIRNVAMVFDPYLERRSPTSRRSSPDVVSGPGQTGVLLIQLGGPQSREELKPFLYELFVDPEILGIPFAPLRKLVAWSIATLRAPKSAETYEKIGWSPIRCWTEKQARSSRRSWPSDGRRRPRDGPCARDDVQRPLRRGGALRSCAPPGPTGSSSSRSTRSTRSRRRAAPSPASTRALAEMRWAPERVDAPDAWYAEPQLPRRPRGPDLRRPPRSSPTRTPRRPSSSTRPTRSPSRRWRRRRTRTRSTSRRPCRRSTRALGHRYRSRLGYQSKVGPVAWLGPSTPEVLAELAKPARSRSSSCPVAFVSDHVETLYEIRMLFARRGEGPRDPDLRRRGGPERPPGVHSRPRRHRREGPPRDNASSSSEAGSPASRPRSGARARARRSSSRQGRRRAARSGRSGRRVHARGGPNTLRTTAAAERLLADLGLEPRPSRPTERLRAGSCAEARLAPSCPAPRASSTRSSRRGGSCASSRSPSSPRGRRLWRTRGSTPSSHGASARRRLCTSRGRWFPASMRATPLAFGAVGVPAPLGGRGTIGERHPGFLEARESEGAAGARPPRHRRGRSASPAASPPS